MQPVLLASSFQPEEHGLYFVRCVVCRTRPSDMFIVSDDGGRETLDIAAMIRTFYLIII
jgi:hypothetical protein